jgi:hypothetical protein
VSRQLRVAATVALYSVAAMALTMTAWLGMALFR